VTLFLAQKYMQGYRKLSAIHCFEKNEFSSVRQSCKFLFVMDIPECITLYFWITTYSEKKYCL